MPFVQRRDANLVSHEPADTGYLKVSPSAEAFGGGMAQAIEGLGQAGFKLAVEVQGRYDETQAKAADVAYADRLRELTGSFQSLQGKAAIDGYEPFRAQVAAARAEYSAGLTPGARRLFDDSAGRRSELALDNATSHSLNERTTWETKTSSLRQEAAVADAGRAWNDEPKLMQSLGIALAEDADQADQMGLGADAAALMQKQTRSRVWQAAITAATPVNPDAALKLLRQHQDEIDPVVAAALLERLQARILPGLADRKADFAVNGGIATPEDGRLLGVKPPLPRKGGPAAAPATPGKAPAAPSGSAPTDADAASTTAPPAGPTPAAPPASGKVLAGRGEAAAPPSGPAPAVDRMALAGKPSAAAPPTTVAGRAAPTPLSVRPAAEHTGNAYLPSPGPAKPPPPYGPSNPLPAALTRAVEQPKVPGQYIKALPPKTARPKRPPPPFKVEPFDLNKMTLQGAPQLKPKEEHRGELTEALTPDMEARVRQSKGAQTVGVDQAIVIAVKIRREAIAQGINPDTALIMALIESNLDPKAVKGGMVGLFQFKADTWKELGGGDRFDADTNIKRAMAYAKKNLEALRQTLGREPTGDELYILHQQGRAGGLALLGAGNRSAVDVLMGVAKIDRAEAERRIRGNGGRVDMTADEYTQMWKDDFYKKLAELDAPAAPKAAPKPAAPKTAAAPKAAPKPPGIPQAGARR